ncbi:hypothetical protein B2D07_14550 [Desulfococcus multivorans]|nr:hypothetical protein B2D07_14550 [Desulfococcus multivorans]
MTHAGEPESLERSSCVIAELKRYADFSRFENNRGPAPAHGMPNPADAREGEYASPLCRRFESESYSRSGIFAHGIRTVAPGSRKNRL